MKNIFIVLDESQPDSIIVNVSEKLNYTFTPLNTILLCNGEVESSYAKYVSVDEFDIDEDEYRIFIRSHPDVYNRIKNYLRDTDVHVVEIYDISKMKT